MDSVTLTQRIWDLLREDCCVTKLKAHCVVMLHEPDVKRLVDRLVAEKIVTIGEKSS